MSENLTTGNFTCKVIIAKVFVAVTIPDRVYSIWGPQEVYIAQLELLMVLVTLLEFPANFRGRQGIWFIDNSAALTAFVRGRGKHPSLDKMAELIHGVMASFQVWMYFEWIESKSNWSDAISREGA